MILMIMAIYNLCKILLMKKFMICLMIIGSLRKKEFLKDKVWVSIYKKLSIEVMIKFYKFWNPS